MKKILVVLLSVCLGAACLGGLAGCKDRGEGITLYVPDGATAIAMSYMMANHREVAGRKVDYRVDTANTVSTAAQNGEADMVVLPANAASALHKKGINYKVAAVVTHGNLFVLGAGIESIHDLDGKTLGCFGNGQIPSLVFEYLLKEYGINEKPEYKPSGTDVSYYVGLGELDCGVVAEPEATNAVKNATMIEKGIKKALDLQELWREKMGDEYVYQGYAQAVLLVKNTIDDEFLGEFLAKCRQGDDEDATIGGHEGGWAAKNPAAVVDAINKNMYGGTESTIKNLDGEQIRDCNAYILTAEDGLKDYVDFCLGKLGVTPSEGFYRTLDE